MVLQGWRGGRFLQLRDHGPYTTQLDATGAPAVVSTADAALSLLTSMRDPRATEGVPLILSDDSTWHRPITTLEFAALQGLPSTIKGKPLQLAGRSSSAWRERIGNAVPVQAATAIAESLLTALVASAVGGWCLGGTGIWVRQRDGWAQELQAEL